MIDISEKKDVVRIAKASGFIKLKKETIQAIIEGKVKKGDVITATKLAAIQAVKKTPSLLPLCHPIPITSVEVNVTPIIDEECVKVEVVVKSIGKTGVEMEALMGVSIGLLNIWDMVKYLEKDERGQYPTTKILDVVVEEKIKGV